MNTQIKMLTLLALAVVGCTAEAIPATLSESESSLDTSRADIVARIPRATMDAQIPMLIRAGLLRGRQSAVQADQQRPDLFNFRFALTSGAVRWESPKCHGRTNCLVIEGSVYAAGSKDGVGHGSVTADITLAVEFVAGLDPDQPELGQQLLARVIDADISNLDTPPLLDIVLHLVLEVIFRLLPLPPQIGQVLHTQVNNILERVLGNMIIGRQFPIGYQPLGKDDDNDETPTAALSIDEIEVTPAGIGVAARYLELGGPDLTVTRIDVPRSTTGNRAPVCVSARNGSPVLAAGHFITVGLFEGDGSQPRARRIGTERIEVLQPMQEAQVCFQVSTSPRAITSFTAVSDVDGQIRELDETNNELTVAVATWPPTDAPAITSVNGTTTVQPGARMNLEILAQDPDNYGDRCSIEARGLPPSATLINDGGRYPAWDSGGCRAVMVWVPGSADTGTRNVEFLARDRSGDLSAPRTVSITVCNSGRCVEI